MVASLDRHTHDLHASAVIFDKSSGNKSGSYKCNHKVRIKHILNAVLSLAFGVSAVQAYASASDDFIPRSSFHDVVYMANVLVPATESAQAGEPPLDVSHIDYFVKKMRPHARHYPPSFANATDRYDNTVVLRDFSEWLEPYASTEAASYEVLMLAAEVNLMARNLDQGETYAVRAGKYIDRATKLRPASAEALFLYGSMLAEGGAFREGYKYLSEAAEKGFHEAHQSIAQVYLLTDRRPEALEKLQYYKALVPADTIVDGQIARIQKGEYYIWKRNF